LLSRDIIRKPNSRAGVFQRYSRDQAEDYERAHSPPDHLLLILALLLVLEIQNLEEQAHYKERVIVMMPAALTVPHG